MEPNIIDLTDSYKITHWKQYPPHTQTVYSYFESRGGDFPATRFFGLQYFLKKYLIGKVVTRDHIEQSKNLWKAHFGKDLFNEGGWNHILNKHDGHLPLSIKAVAEGRVIPTHNVLVTIENTDPVVPWLTNYVESLLVQVWYPITVCTQSYEIKKIIQSFLEETGSVEGLPYKLHDFGFRGVSSVESAEIGGAAHLVNFQGTDNMAGAKMAMNYYNNESAAAGKKLYDFGFRGSSSVESAGIGGAAHLVNFQGSTNMTGIGVAMNYYQTHMPGVSIPAAEHSTITSWGRDHEVDAYENMINMFGDGLFACVSDSYDVYKACSDLWGEKLKDRVLQMKGNLVIRPDSGNPVEVVLKCLDILGEKFGTETNAKGYRVLHPKIRLIQGDGINLKSINEILTEMKDKKWSADNIAFGMGGALLQQVNRDTLKFAWKCSAIQIKNEWRSVYKNPITDTGKASKKGRLKLVEGQTLPINELGKDELREVFRDGKLLVDDTFEEIRNK